MLGGKDNYAADRAAVDELTRIVPETVSGARANRAFLGRVVRYLAAEAGIRQFLDLGTGIPTAGNTHEVAQSVAPEVRVAYVDYELLDFTRPVAVTMLTILHAIPDADDPGAIVARLLDAVPSASYLAISHGASDLLSREELASVRNVMDSRVQQTITFRTREQVARFFEGTDLVEPGLVAVEDWRPEPGTDWADKSYGWGGAGRKP